MRTDLVHQKRSVCTYLENCESWAASYISHNMCRKKEMWLLRSVYNAKQFDFVRETVCSVTFFTHLQRHLWQMTGANRLVWYKTCKICCI